MELLWLEIRFQYLSCLRWKLCKDTIFGIRLSAIIGSKIITEQFIMIGLNRPLPWVIRPRHSNSYFTITIWPELLFISVKLNPRPLLDESSANFIIGWDPKIHPFCTPCSSSKQEARKFVIGLDLAVRFWPQQKPIDHYPSDYIYRII